jgi:hypothetical protein
MPDRGRLRLRADRGGAGRAGGGRCGRCGRGLEFGQLALQVGQGRLELGDPFLGGLLGLGGAGDADAGDPGQQGGAKSSTVCGHVVPSIRRQARRERSLVHHLKPIGQLEIRRQGVLKIQEIVGKGWLPVFEN